MRREIKELREEITRQYFELHNVWHEELEITRRCDILLELEERHKKLTGRWYHPERKAYTPSHKHL